jgi:glycosyltransferase involved in cell wall biosynthesis
MRIAFLTTFVPWPPDSGTRIRNYQMLRFLAARGEVHLVVVSTGAEPTAAWPAGLKLAGMRVCDPGGEWAGRGGYLRARAAQQLHLRPCVYRPGLRRRVADLLDELAPEVLIAYGTASAQYIDLERRRPGTRYLFDEAGADHLRSERLLAVEQGTARRLKRGWELWRLRRYERQVCTRADGLLAVVPSEEAYLRRWNREVSLVPCGANLDLIDFHYAGDDNRTLLFCGDLTYGPNEDAVAYFLADVFPAVAAKHPEVSFAVVGRYRGERLPGLAARFPQVHLAGYAEEMAPQWRRASIFVNPMRTGRGFITKILDAFTAGLAVVSTDFLTADLGIVPGRHFLSAANAGEFAAAVCALLERPERKRELAREGRRFAEAHTWEAALAPLWQVVAGGKE